MRKLSPTRRRRKAGAARDNRQVVHARSTMMPAMRVASQRESYSIAQGLFVFAIVIAMAAFLIGCLSASWHMGYDAAKVEVSANA